MSLTGDSRTPQPHQTTVERPYAEHSPACQDANLLDYDDEYIGKCICRPYAGVKPPDTYELWWCEWCGEPAAEGSDPCQECGSPATRRLYAKVAR